MYLMANQYVYAMLNFHVFLSILFNPSLYYKTVNLNYHITVNPLFFLFFY